MRISNTLTAVAVVALAACDTAFLHSDIPDRLDANVAGGNPPDAPTNLTATPLGARVQLEWEAPPDAETFNLYWGQSPTPRPESGAIKIEGVTRPYEHIGLTAGTTYYYVVTATNGAGESDYSNETSATPYPACAPNAPPADLTGVYAGADQIDLAWVCDATNEDGFIVERQPEGGSWGELLRVGADAVSATDDNFSMDQEYRYRVKAYKDDCETAPTNVIVLWTPPNQPGDFVGDTEAFDAIVLTWTDTNARETAHQLERRLGGVGSFEPIADLAANVTSHSDTGLDSDTVYEYRLVAQNPEHDSTAAVASRRTSALPALAWIGDATLEPGCELVMEGSATYDTGADLQPPAELFSADGSITGNVTGTVTASDALWRGTLDVPNPGGAFTASWTIEDSYSGAVTITRGLDLAREVRNTTAPLIASGVLGEDNAAGRQAIAVSGCTSCTGQRSSLALGRGHSCAIDDTGSVSCWGSNSNNTLAHGLATSFRADNPQPVCETGLGPTCNLGAPVTGTIGLAGGYLTTCATIAGERHCWGDNLRGQQGNGNADPVFHPVLVCESGEGPGCTALTGVDYISPGTGHTCALMTDDTVLCWGYRFNGVLGDGAGSVGESRFTPEPVCATGTGATCVDLAGVGQVASGTMHNCALVAGGVQCWGRSYDGQLGIDDPLGGSSVARSNPVEVCSVGGCGSPLTGVADVVAGERHTCAVLSDEQMLCWGRGVGLGNGNLSNQPLPTGVCESGAWDGAACAGGARLGGVKTVWSGYQNVCAHVDTNADTLPDRLLCWGDNRHGQTGVGETSIFTQTNPADVCATGSITGGDCIPLTGVSDLAIGRDHMCALLGDETVVCWGENASGQVGSGIDDDTDVLNPSVVCASGSDTSCVALAGVEELAAALDHTCARLATGDLVCWGSTRYMGQGDANTSINPIETCTSGDYPGCIGGARTPAMTMLSSLTLHTCGVTAAGEVICWGLNDADFPPETGSTVPILGDALPGVRGYAVTVCESGQGPDCPKLTGAIEVATGREHSCVLLAGGGVRCWGRGEYGRLGADNQNHQLLPTPVLCSTQGDGCTAGGDALTSVVGLAAGQDHTCALLATGVVKCWGYQDQGRLGDGFDTATYRATAGDVCVNGESGAGGCTGAPFSGAVQIVAGPAHTCALMETGRAKCWGLGLQGALGTGEDGVLIAPNPVDVCDDSGPPCTPLEEVIALAAGGNPIDGAPEQSSTCALRADGGVYCWGYNEYGQVGVGSTSYNPVNHAQPVCTAGSFATCVPLDGAVAISVGSVHACAQLASGQTLCWGRGVQTGVENGTFPNASDPVCGTGEGTGCTPWDGGAHASCEVYSLP